MRKINFLLIFFLISFSVLAQEEEKESTDGWTKGGNVSLLFS